MEPNEAMTSMKNGLISGKEVIISLASKIIINTLLSQLGYGLFDIHETWRICVQHFKTKECILLHYIFNMRSIQIGSQVG